MHFPPLQGVKETILMRNEKLRNIAIIAHVDHGKTAPLG